MSWADYLVVPVLTLAMLLVGSALAKLREPSVVARSLPMEGHDALGVGVVIALAVGEAACAVAVVWRPGPATLAAAATLFAGFSLYAAWSVHRGRTTAPCGCFGSQRATLGRHHVAWNLLAATVLATAAAGWSAPGWLLEPVAEGAGAAVLTVLAAGAGALLLFAALTSAGEVERLRRVGRPHDAPLAVPPTQMPPFAVTTHSSTTRNAP